MNMLSVINYAMGDPSLKSTVYLSPDSLFLNHFPSDKYVQWLETKILKKEIKTVLINYILNKYQLWNVWTPIHLIYFYLVLPWHMNHHSCFRPLPVVDIVKTCKINQDMHLLFSQAF